ncbi:MAG TPA: protein translocase subunit SecF [Gammaproteobacteria bacterium]|nr:protein translocase subunit SecF [Gammaproteobacteria bacterium]
MEFFKKQTNINFMGIRHQALVLSTLLSVAAFALLAFRGLNFGIDFTGGVRIEVGYPVPVELDEVRIALEKAGFSDLTVQHIGSAREVSIRMRPTEESSAAVSTRVLEALRDAQREVEMRSVEFVGPQVGQELTEQGFLAMIFALIGIMMYVWARFEFKLAVSSIIATAHDVVLVIGFFALMQYPFDLTVLAAVLAVIGYSLNDTIVVFDRLRECFREMRRGTPLEIANAAINQTISRTLMTGVTTLLVLLSLYFFGGETLQPFSIALIFGVLVGTYSSIYVASATALAFGLTKQDLMPVKKEDLVDDLP